MPISALTLETIQAVGGGLVAVPGLGIHGGDHPVLGHPAGYPEHPVGAFVQVAPTRVASNASAWLAGPSSLRPSRAPSNAMASLARASTRTLRATASS